MAKKIYGYIDIEDRGRGRRLKRKLEDTIVAFGADCKIRERSRAKQSKEKHINNENINYISQADSHCGNCPFGGISQCGDEKRRTENEILFIYEEEKKSKE